MRGWVPAPLSLQGDPCTTSAGVEGEVSDPLSLQGERVRVRVLRAWGGGGSCHVERSPRFTAQHPLRRFVGSRDAGCLIPSPSMGEGEDGDGPAGSGVCDGLACRLSHWYAGGIRMMPLWHTSRRGRLMTRETGEIHPDTPAWFIPYLLQNRREHYDLGSRIDRYGIAPALARVRRADRHRQHHRHCGRRARRSGGEVPLDTLPHATGPPPGPRSGPPSGSAPPPGPSRRCAPPASPASSPS